MLCVSSGYSSSRGLLEISEGTLEPGEQVITSPYTSFVGMDRLMLNAD